MVYQDIILEEFAEIHHRIYYIRNNRWFCHRFRIWRHVCYLPSHGNQGYGSKFQFNSDLCSNGHCRNNLIGYRCALGFTICPYHPPCYAQAKRRKAETLEHLQRGSQTPGQHFPDGFLGNDHYLHHFLYRTDTNLHHELGTDVISNGSFRWRPAWSPCLFHPITFDCLEYHDICPDIRCKLVRHFLCLSLWFKYQSGEKEKRTAKYK